MLNWGVNRYMKPKKLKIIERKLGQYDADGLSWGNGTIEIDSRLKGKKRLRICVHELTHELCEYLTEEEVIKIAKFISDGLWQDNYRRQKND